MGQRAPANDRGGQRRARLGGPLPLLAALSALLLIPVAAQAATSLSNPQVSPRTASAGDVVTFSVSTTGNANVTVQVQLAGAGAKTIVYDMTVYTGRGGTTTWRFQTTGIPVDTWAVTFAVAGTTETLAAGSLAVIPVRTPVPTPTPKPTTAPTPTPRPTPIPTSTPVPATTPRATSSVAASGSPGSTAVASPVGVGGSIAPVGTASPGLAASAGSRSPSPTGTAAGTSTDDRTGPLLLSVLLGLFVIAGVAGIAILTSRRRAEEQPPAAAPPPPARKRASWEVYSALEDEPIGTVDDLTSSADVPAYGSTDPGPSAPGEDD